MKLRYGVGVWMLAGMAGTACSPAVDWREMRPPGLGLTMTMPCRPATQVRSVSLADRAVDMTLYACREAGVTYSVGSFDVGDPALVGAMLIALVKAAQVNVQGHAESDEPARVPGMTPHSAARQIQISGRLPDGRVVREWLLVFARGTRVYQAIALGGPSDAALAQQFGLGLKVLH